MANRWETIETVRDFLFLRLKITADVDCSHETKRCLFLGRKAMTNLDSILKNRDITLSIKAHLVKVMVLPGVIRECESCTIKKAERRRIDAFELWCWRRLYPLGRRKWQPTPVFLPGESQGRGSLVGCHLWGRTE